LLGNNLDRECAECADFLSFARASVRHGETGIELAIRAVNTGDPANSLVHGANREGKTPPKGSS
jgi:hypothetical protein